MKKKINHRFGALKITCGKIASSKIFSGQEMADITPQGPIAVLCLGKRLLPDGAPTNMLKLRVACASAKLIALRDSKADAWLVVTGGLVQKGKGISTEAQVRT